MKKFIFVISILLYATALQANTPMIPFGNFWYDWARKALLEVKLPFQIFAPINLGGSLDREPGEFEPAATRQLIHFFSGKHGIKVGPNFEGLNISLLGIRIEKDGKIVADLVAFAKPTTYQDSSVFLSSGTYLPSIGVRFQLLYDPAQLAFSFKGPPVFIENSHLEKTQIGISSKGLPLNGIMAGAVEIFQQGVLNNTSSLDTFASSLHLEPTDIRISFAQRFRTGEMTLGMWTSGPDTFAVPTLVYGTLMGQLTTTSANRKWQHRPDVVQKGKDCSSIAAHLR